MSDRQLVLFVPIVCTPLGSWQGALYIQIPEPCIQHPRRPGWVPTVQSTVSAVIVRLCDALVRQFFSMSLRLGRLTGMRTVIVASAVLLYCFAKAVQLFEQMM